MKKLVIYEDRSFKQRETKLIMKISRGIIHTKEIKIYTILAKKKTIYILAKNESDS